MLLSNLAEKYSFLTSTVVLVWLVCISGLSCFSASAMTLPMVSGSMSLPQTGVNTADSEGTVSSFQVTSSNSQSHHMHEGMHEGMSHPPVGLIDHQPPTHNSVPGRFSETTGHTHGLPGKEGSEFSTDLTEKSTPHCETGDTSTCDSHEDALTSPFFSADSFAVALCITCFTLDSTPSTIIAALPPSPPPNQSPHIQFCCFLN